MNVPFISVDNKEGAYLAAKTLSDQITTPAEAAILEGIRTARNAQDRKAGALKAFGENRNITVVASESADWKIDEAYSVTKAIFEQHPDVKILFASNDLMALGAIQYLVDTGRTDVLVSGYDALDEAKQAIKEGKLAVSIDQQTAEQGYMGVEYAVRALNGEELPAITLLDVKVVRADSLK